MKNVMRSVSRDGKAMSRGIDKIDAEIKFLENSKRKVRSVKQRLERLRAARTQLIENPESSTNLIDTLKGIQNEST